MYSHRCMYLIPISLAHRCILGCNCLWPARRTNTFLPLFCNCPKSTCVAWQCHCLKWRSRVARLLLPAWISQCRGARAPLAQTLCFAPEGRSCPFELTHSPWQMVVHDRKTNEQQRCTTDDEQHAARSSTWTHVI